MSSEKSIRKGSGTRKPAAHKQAVSGAKSRAVPTAQAAEPSTRRETRGHRRRRVCPTAPIAVDPLPSGWEPEGFRDLDSAARLSTATKQLLVEIAVMAAATINAWEANLRLRAQPQNPLLNDQLIPAPGFIAKSIECASAWLALAEREVQGHREWLAGRLVATGVEFCGETHASAHAAVIERAANIVRRAFFLCAADKLKHGEGVAQPTTAEERADLVRALVEREHRVWQMPSLVFGHGPHDEGARMIERDASRLKSALEVEERLLRERPALSDDPVRALAPRESDTDVEAGGSSEHRKIVGNRLIILIVVRAQKALEGVIGSDIAKAMGGDRTRQSIARELSGLVKDGYLSNQRPHGYLLTPKALAFLRERDRRDAELSKAE